MSADGATPPGENDSRLNPARVAGRARFAEVLKETLLRGHHAGHSLVTAWGTVWGLSRQKIETWANPLAIKSAITCGDLDALDDADWELVIATWREARERRRGPAPRRAIDPADEVALVLCELGEASRTAIAAKADGVVKRHEWAEVLARLDAVEAKLRESRRAVRAARDGADR